MKIKSSLLVLSTLGAFSVASAQTGSGMEQSTTNIPGSSSNVPTTSTGRPDTNKESSGAIRQEDRTGIYNPSDTEAQPQPQKAKRGTRPLPSDSTNEKDTGVNNPADPLSGPGPKGP